MRPHAKALSAAALALTLTLSGTVASAMDFGSLGSSAGGSLGGSPSTTTPTTPTTPPTTPPSSGRLLPPTPANPTDIQAAELRISQDFQAFRARKGLAAPTWSASLTEQARAYGEKLAAANPDLLVHDPNLSTLRQGEALYRQRDLAMSGTITTASILDAVAKWEASPPHYRTMSDVNARQYGIAVVYDAVHQGYYVVLRTSN